MSIGQVDVVARLRREDRVPELVRETPSWRSASANQSRASSMSLRFSGRWNHWASIASWPAMMSWLFGAGSGRPLAHRQRVAGAVEGDVGHGGPHRPLVGVGAADPAAEQEELGEELLAHCWRFAAKGLEFMNGHSCRRSHAVAVQGDEPDDAERDEAAELPARPKESVRPSVRPSCALDCVRTKRPRAQLSRESRSMAAHTRSTTRAVCIGPPLISYSSFLVDLEGGDDRAQHGIVLLAVELAHLAHDQQRAGRAFRGNACGR